MLRNLLVHLVLRVQISHVVQSLHALLVLIALRAVQKEQVSFAWF